MIRTSFIVFLFIQLPFCKILRDTDGTQSSLQELINESRFGDTIQLPPKTIKLQNTLVVHKMVSIFGDSSGLTKIIPSVLFNDFSLLCFNVHPIYEQPSYPVTINHVTFDLLNRSITGIEIINEVETIPVVISITHDSICNVQTSKHSAIKLNGSFLGHIKNNTISTIGAKVLFFSGNGEHSWRKSISFGSDNNMFFEDNEITSQGEDLFTFSNGTRCIIRYNSISATRDIYPLFNLKGNNDSVYSVVSTEIYGNRIDMNGFTCQFVMQGGGQSLVYYNLIRQCDFLYRSKLYESHADHSGLTEHVNNSYFWCNFSDDTPLQPSVKIRDISASPYSNTVRGENFETSWLNKTLLISDANGTGIPFLIIAAAPSRLTLDTTGVGPVKKIATPKSRYQIVNDCCQKLTENHAYWNQQQPFTGDSGCGSGLLAHRPTTCAVNVAYWATDLTCSSDTSWTGRNHDPDISGTLYKCLSPNTWSEYYAPSPYPHTIQFLDAPINLFFKGNN